VPGTIAIQDASGDAQTRRLVEMAQGRHIDILPDPALLDRPRPDRRVVTGVSPDRKFT
jgi:hypothetical protein